MEDIELTLAAESSHVVAVSPDGKRVTQTTTHGGRMDVQVDEDEDDDDGEDLSEAASGSHVPPKAVQAAARRGLELRKQHGRGGWDSRKAHANGMGSGVVRAQTLASGRSVSGETLRRMRSFFARHDGAREREARQRDETSPANIAWLLWGGDPGREWAEKELKGLQEMDEQLYETTCLEIGVEPLQEAGGVISWLKRNFSNVDDSIAGEIRDELAAITTEAERQALLHELDGFITEAKAAQRDGTFGDILSSLGLGFVSGLAGGVAGMVKGGLDASKMAAPVFQAADKVKGGFFADRLGVTALKQSVVDAKSVAAHQAATAAHKAGQFGKVVNATVTGVNIAFMAASLVSIIFKTLNRYNGSLERYVESLVALRREVAAYRIPRRRD